MVYARTSAQRAGDFAAARPIEELVGSWLPDLTVANLDSTSKMDYWVPGLVVEVKAKMQPLTTRWHLLPGVAEPNLFVLDELSVRKLAASPLLPGYPLAYFVLFDKPQDRWFLGRLDEVFCANKARSNRVGGTGWAKGKWVIDLSELRRLPDPSVDLMREIRSDIENQPWKRSECISQLEIGQV